MSFYRDRVYPHLVSLLGDPPPIRKVRQKIIPGAQGIVLEIGVGSGANFIHYNPETVHLLYALEPNPGMRRLAERQGTRLPIQYIELPGEKIPLENGSIDTVVSTFTLCTIPGIMEALQEIRRVMKTRGRFIFFELGGSPDPEVRRCQTWLEPVHHRLFQGLYLTRDIPALIRQSGFQIDQMETAYLARFPRALSHCWWGHARPQD